MNAFLWILLLLAAICALYLFLIAPSRARPDAGALKGWLYAHRGLHDGNHEIPENSLAAFRRAVESGYGMELDVQLTKDGRLVVHHDGNLKRVCGVDRDIRDMTYEELCAVPLPDGSKVPLFQEVLELVDGRAPLIVEVKHYGSPSKNASATLKHLRAYNGPYCVESFNPIAMRYFKKNAPDIVRGQLSMGGKRTPGELGPLSFLALKSLMVNCISRPHFIAYSVSDDRTLGMWLMRRLFHPLLAAWTIRGQETLEKSLARGYSLPIFELFTPQRSDRG